MTGFAPAWLDLREPADHACRAPGLARRLGAHLESRPQVTVADLGAGTGANLRWLACWLPGSQHWQLLEHDPALLRGIAPRVAAWARRHDLEPVLQHDGMTLTGARTLHLCWRHADLRHDPLPARGVDLVTASALVDLVSPRWLQQLVSRCARQQAAVLLAVNYDGRIALSPRHPFDARVRDAHNAHQRGDKGFGPAAGPSAVATVTRLLRERGYRVFQARSDWRLDHRSADLAGALVDGWHRSAREHLPGRDGPAADRWHEFRTRHLATDTAHARVGHVDLLALPPR